jgi:GNAT superfamily N-acetyltransferase
MTGSQTRCAVRAGLLGLTEFHRPALLDLVRHDRGAFDSGEATLDQWLRRYAGQNRRRDTAATWVIANSEQVVVAYATVAMTGVDRSSAPTTLAKQAPDPVPALLIGRLAVDQRHARIGLGTALVAHVLATAIELNEKAACRAVIVSAMNPDARCWWEHLGFRGFEPTNERSQDLYLLTKDIQATLEQLH